MALEADCRASTVLEALRVASTVGFLVPGECRASPALTVSCKVFRDAVGDLVVHASRVHRGLLSAGIQFQDPDRLSSRRQIRNSKFEILWGGWFGIGIIPPEAS